MGPSPNLIECQKAGCPDQYGFKAGCAWHGDCMPEVNNGTPNDMNEHLCKLGPYHSNTPGVWCTSGVSQEPEIGRAHV